MLKVTAKTGLDYIKSVAFISFLVSLTKASLCIYSKAYSLKASRNNIFNKQIYLLVVHQYLD
jgi:hypothetical protein